jgi:glutaredoxin-like protein NrdH
MMALMIEVYTGPGCSACNATKAWLNREGLAYNEIDISADDEAQKRCKAMGYAELPVVVAGEQHWSGFRYDRLRELKALVRG